MCQPWRVTDGSRKAILAAFFAKIESDIHRASTPG